MQAIRVPPIITLTTDFGLGDHYVGVMKGVILNRCRNVRLVDISHEIPPFSIALGAYTIDQASSYFPPGTIHVVVIDPGVGTARKALLVEALDQYFIAPDNGVLSMIIARDRSAKAYEITNRDLWLPSTSSTFHGRDVFAPVAAALASGAATAADVGPPAAEVELLPNLQPEEVGPGVWRGVVLSVDRFGNVITNFGVATFAGIAFSRFILLVSGHEIALFQKTFGDAPTGRCFAYFGSSGYIEVGANQGSAAALLRVSPGNFVQLRL